MRHERFALILGLIPLVTSSLPGQALFVKPVNVLGDPNFIGTASRPLAFDSYGPNVVEGRELNQPLAIALDNSITPPIVYIADTGNNRVLAFQYQTQLTAGAYADLILGQPDRFTNLAQGPSASSLTTGLRAPAGLAVDSAGNLYVADTGNNRIVRYPKPFSQPPGYQFPDMILGQSSFSTYAANSGGIQATTLSLSSGSHTGLAFDSAGNLWVTDTGNHRVLRFPVAVLTAGQNDPAADTVIGQTNLTSAVAKISQTSLTNLYYPTGVSFDSTGDMLVADALDRVVMYTQGSIATGASGAQILGVTTGAVSNTQLGNTTSAIAAGSFVLVVDNGDNRVLTFNSVAQWGAQTASTSSPAAVAVLGQANFSSSTANGGGLPSATVFNSPVDIAASTTEVFVADSGNNRVLVFPFGPAGLGGSASRVIGQLDFPYNAPNLVVGAEFYLAGGSNAASGSAVLDLSSTPPHLYVADTQNNRILGFNDFTHAVTGQTADIVIGQPDLFHTVVNYPSGTAGTPNAEGLNGPSSLAVDSAGNLYVADTYNSRILCFPAPFASGTTALEPASLVIGQQNFTSIVTDPTQLTMSAPIALAFTQAGADASMTASGYLVAADAAQNRVLLFQKPFSNGMEASMVIGQSSFDSTSASSTATGLSSPRALAVDPLDDIVVADTGNSRVQVFPAVSSLPEFAAAPSFSLTSGLSAPVGIGMGPAGDFWVADQSNNELFHYPSIDELPIDNYASDTSAPAVSPRSAFVDQYNNLLVADGINRVLYYAPQLAVVNAANYISGRALAAGAFAAVFPSVSTNVLATGTASASAFPLPTTLGGSEVIVNGTPSPLFYVSPGQINFPLSMSLPAGGTANVEVVSAATGQVYGGAEIALNSASPGLFTSNGTGTGPVAAINAVDGSVNTAANPVARGQYISLYGTGQGPVANAPADGQAPAGPVPTALNPQILLGGAYVPSSDIEYSGLAPGLAGVWQINFMIPSTAPTGSDVSIEVLMNSIPSNNPSVAGQIADTISIK